MSAIPNVGVYVFLLVAGNTNETANEDFSSKRGFQFCQSVSPAYQKKRRFYKS